MAQDQILVVEDDPEIAAILRQGFEQESLRVQVAQEGREALDIARKQTFETIVLDVMLPVMDGYAVARELRAAGDSTPILMLTARDAVSDIVLGLDSGVDDYLTKPFSFLELSARVRALMRRSQTRATRLTVGDLVVNLSTCAVYRGSRQLHLTKTEFQLLQVLMTNKGQVVRRSDLLRGAWGAGVSVEENTLDAAMSSLRSRVELPQMPRLIHTVRGFGYRMEVPQ